jgi:hypothetical protein
MRPSYELLYVAASDNFLFGTLLLHSRYILVSKAPLSYFGALTYMSIRDEIRRLTKEREPRLFFLPPLLPGVALLRELFVSEEINRAVCLPWPSTPIGRRHARMRTYLDAWTEGRLITVADHPYNKPRDTFMARIDPGSDEVFDIRCRYPKPGIRVLGLFADCDLFIALTTTGHENLITGRDWRDEREACKAAWRRLFPTYHPFSGANLHEYISTNIHIV